MSSKMHQIVWREWYNAPAVAQMEAMGTLPKETIDIDCRYLTKDEVAAEIARRINLEDSESFARGGEIVIISPEEFAGTYSIDVDWTPSFSACEADLD